MDKGEELTEGGYLMASGHGFIYITRTEVEATHASRCRFNILPPHRPQQQNPLVWVSFDAD